MDYRSRVKKALAGFEKRQEIEIKPRRKNKKPEKAVEQEILLWCRQKGFDVDVVESKAKFNTITGLYTGKATIPGMSDILGNTSDGRAVFIELKAKGRRVGSALREEQRAFLIRKIKGSCFAVVTDSIEYIEDIWMKYQALFPHERIPFLLSELPKHTHRKDSDLEW